MGSSVGASYRVTKRVANNGNLDVRVFGFKPERIVVQNLTNDVRAEWNRALAVDEAILTIAAGTRTLETTNGFSLLDGTSVLPPGFRLKALANVNDNAVGVPTITGTVQEDQILTADTVGISDADGLGAFSYQWLRSGAVIGAASGCSSWLNPSRCSRSPCRIAAAVIISV